MHHYQNSDLCWGCLSSGRRKALIKYDKQQFLYDFIGDNKILPKDLIELMEYCWECTAMFAKLMKFKNRVRASYTAMKYCLAKNLDVTALQKPPKLNIHRQFNISYDDNLLDQEDSFCKLPKVEEQSFEDDPASMDHISDDNNYLMPLPEKKKPVKSKKKKRDCPTKKYEEIELSKEEIEKERQGLSGRETFVNAHFKCDFCLNIFANADDFKDHNESRHNVVTAFKCDICQSYFNSVVSLTYHSHTHSRRYDCSICAKRHNTKRMAEKHYDETHVTVPDNRVNFQDQIEDDDKQTNDLLIERNGTENLYTCEHCPKKFKWKTSLHRHVMSHAIADGKKRQPYCEACGLSFTNAPNLRNHIKTSSKHQIQLKLMKLKESETQSLDDMEEIKDSIMKKMQWFPCGMCDKRFQWRGNLQRHLQSHATKASRELVCEPCNRTFSSIATYKQHMQMSKKHVSEIEFKYTCSDCDKKFPIKQKLKDHINWEHLKNFVHSCDKCDKVFKHRLNLQQHSQSVHSKNCGEHLCHECGRAFPNQSKLNSHVLAVHSSSPHKCKLCGAKFGWRSCLARHLKRIHCNRQEVKP